MQRPSPAHRRTTATAAMAATAALALTACGPAADGPAAGEGLERSDAERAVIAVADAPASADAVRATEELGLLALRATEEPEGNALVSPASLSFALALLAEGADGDTAAALDEALGASGTDRTSAYNALQGALAEHDGDPAVAQDDELPEKPVLHLANQAVIDDELEVDPAYLDRIATAFDAGFQRIDLGSDTGKKVLDAWVNQHTGGLIEKSAIEPDLDLRMVLQNAVLLAARWETPFAEHSTADEDFTGPSGTEPTEMLHAAESFAYAESDGWAAVRLPYADAFHADVLLPPAGTDPADVSPGTLTALTTVLDAETPRLVDLAMPSLELEPPPLDLAPAMEEAGLGGLYGAPDLSGITTSADLRVSQAMQQAYLSLDEAGTVAAAVTEIAMKESAAVPADPEVTMQVDRPYLLRIAHTETKLPLFLAAVRSPQH
ncbi:serpin family protein [Promicromonospora sp. NFX87]|uniref:serpin family protein n=1 Tax=Promicromonospora sp. NFX87 TaxID=3402691 RepID=UPI003AFB55E7